MQKPLQQNNEFDFSLVMTEEELDRKRRLFENAAGVMRKLAAEMEEMGAKRRKYVRKITAQNSLQTSSDVI